MKKDKRINFRINEDVYAGMKATADINDMSVSDLIRYAIDNFVKYLDKKNGV